MAHQQQKYVQLVQQDSQRVSDPDVQRPFASVKDAVDRLLPYHVSVASSAPT